MTREEFKARTKAFALRAVTVAESLPSDPVSKFSFASSSAPRRRSPPIIGPQFAANPARISSQRWGIVEEECDKTLFWLEMLADTKRVPPARIADLQREGNEIISIVVASIKTARRGR